MALYAVRGCACDVYGVYGAVISKLTHNFCINLCIGKLSMQKLVCDSLPKGRVRCRSFAEFARGVCGGCACFGFHGVHTCAYDVQERCSAEVRRKLHVCGLGDLKTKSFFVNQRGLKTEGVFAHPGEFEKGGFVQTMKA